METLKTVKLIVEALESKMGNYTINEGSNIKVIEIDGISEICDYMVIATGSSNTHIKALADEVEYQLNESGISVSHIEGYRSNNWILLDYVDVIVHIFTEEAREYYNLERLWKDGKEIEVLLDGTGVNKKIKLLKDNQEIEI